MADLVLREHLQAVDAPNGSQEAHIPAKIGYTTPRDAIRAGGRSGSSALRPEAKPAAMPSTRWLHEYNQWLSGGRRAVPSGRVVAGHAGKSKVQSLNNGHLRAFEVAHGIPQKTLKFEREYAHAVGVAVRTEWRPSEYHLPSNLSAQQLAAHAHAGNNGARPEDMYRSWKEMPPEQQIVPSGKVVAGHAPKSRVDLLNASDLRTFEHDHGIPSNTLEFERNTKGGNVSGVMERVPGSWDPVSYASSSVAAAPPATGYENALPTGSPATHYSATGYLPHPPAGDYYQGTADYYSADGYHNPLQTPGYPAPAGIYSTNAQNPQAYYATANTATAHQPGYLLAQSAMAYAPPPRHPQSDATDPYSAFLPPTTPRKPNPHHR